MENSKYKINTFKYSIYISSIKSFTLLIFLFIACKTKPKEDNNKNKIIPDNEEKVIHLEDNNSIPHNISKQNNNLTSDSFYDDLAKSYKKKSIRMKFLTNADSTKCYRNHIKQYRLYFIPVLENMKISSVFSSHCKNLIAEVKDEKKLDKYAQQYFLEFIKNNQNRTLLDRGRRIFVKGAFSCLFHICLNQFDEFLKRLSFAKSFMKFFEENCAHFMVSGLSLKRVERYLANEILYFDYMLLASVVKQKGLDLDYIDSLNQNLSQKNKFDLQIIYKIFPEFLVHILQYDNIDYNKICIEIRAITDSFEDVTKLHSFEQKILRIFKQKSEFYRSKSNNYFLQFKDNCEIFFNTWKPMLEKHSIHTHENDIECNNKSIFYYAFDRHKFNNMVIPSKRKMHYIKNIVKLIPSKHHIFITYLCFKEIFEVDRLSQIFMESKMEIKIPIQIVEKIAIYLEYIQIKEKYKPFYSKYIKSKSNYILKNFSLIKNEELENWNKAPNALLLEPLANALNDSVNTDLSLRQNYKMFLYPKIKKLLNPVLNNKLNILFDPSFINDKCTKQNYIKKDYIRLIEHCFNNNKTLKIYLMLNEIFEYDRIAHIYMFVKTCNQKINEKIFVDLCLKILSYFHPKNIPITKCYCNFYIAKLAYLKKNYNKIKRDEKINWTKLVNIYNQKKLSFNC